MSLFIELLQVALGTRESLSYQPDIKEWNELFEKSQVQTITGILVDGLERLPVAQSPPANILLEWIGYAQAVENCYKIHKAVAAKALECLYNGGIKTAFMKGLVCGARYAHPERRQCGDIDL